MSRTRRVREPLQVYLDRDERSLLDRLSEETGLSRAEILRRGIQSFAAATGVSSPMLDVMDALTETDLPADLAPRHDDYLADEALDRH